MQHEWTPHGGRPAAGKNMGYFLWTEAMSVGVPALDADHKCLVRIINILRELDREEGATATVEAVLDSLKLYGRTHFKREERVMDAVRFPGGAFHRAEHQNFVQHIEFLRSRFTSGQLEPARELYDYLTGWLRHHILIQDMAYKPYVSNAPNADSVANEAAPPLPNIVGLLPSESLSA
jgi:hemerythrin-like metal-binding protein